MKRLIQYTFLTTLFLRPFWTWPSIALMDRVAASSENASLEAEPSPDKNVSDRHENDTPPPKGDPELSQDAYVQKSSANRKLEERSHRARSLALSSSGQSSPVMAALSGNNVAGALSSMATNHISGAAGAGALAAAASGLSGAAGTLGTMAGSLGTLKGLTTMGGLGSLGLMGLSAGNMGMLAGGSALMELSKGVVSKDICFTACNRASCKSSRVRALCAAKCGDNPQTIQNCLSQGD